MLKTKLMKKIIFVLTLSFLYLGYACTKDKSKTPTPILTNEEAKNDSLASLAYNNKIKAITDRCATAGCHTANKATGIGDFTSYTGIKNKVKSYSLASYKSKGLGVMSDCTDYECLTTTEKTDLGTWLDAYFK
jgi:hypothetical protein